MKETKNIKKFDQLCAIVERATPQDGMTETIIPFLSFMRASQTTSLTQGILNPSFCLIVQGRKKVHIGKDTIHYGVGDFLVASTHVPAAGQIIGASKSAPYYCVRIELDAKEIADVVIEAKIDVRSNKETVSGAFVGKSDPELQEAIFKLLRVLDKPKDAAFLAGSIKREIIYRLLVGKDGHLLYQNVLISQSKWCSWRRL